MLRIECSNALAHTTQVRTEDGAALPKRNHFPRTLNYTPHATLELGGHSGETDKIDFDESGTLRRVRNLVRKTGVSFPLQTTTDRFYPDFVCMLPDDRILVVENKSARDWNTAEEDRKIGKLWEEMSKGKCLFVMVKERKWECIDSLLP